MIPALSLSIVVLLAVLAVVAAAMAIIGRPPNRGLLTGLVIAELELVAHALVAIVAQASGNLDAPLGPLAGYLLISVVLVPLVARFGETERTRWDSAAVAAVCVAVAVVVLRLLSFA